MSPTRSLHHAQLGNALQLLPLNVGLLAVPVVGTSKPLGLQYAGFAIGNFQDSPSAGVRVRAGRSSQALGAPLPRPTCSAHKSRSPPPPWA